MTPTPFCRVAAAGALTIAGLAHAGQCPADKVAANDRQGAATAAVGVVDTELVSIELAHESVKPDERRLRLRHMHIAPGGIVPLHSHEDRPALIMVNAGEICEYAGEVAREFLGTRHWWKNTGTEPVDLTIGDIVNDGKPMTMEKMM